MGKEFVTYEIALELKELGFDEPCLGYYENNGKNNLLVTDSVNFTNTDLKVEGISSPLYQQAFRWFREKYSIQATIEPTKDQHRFELGFNYWIWNTKTAEEWFTEPRDRPAGDYVFDTYEEAELACLEKLIEITKVK